MLYKLIEDIRDSLNCGILLSPRPTYSNVKTDRVICLNGHVCCSGTPAKWHQFKSLLEIGPHLVLHCTAHHDHEHLPDGSIRTEKRTKTQHNVSSKNLVSNDVDEANENV